MSDNKSIINLEAPASPAILAGILGINVSMVFQGRQTNILPPDASASYRQCIQHYTNHWKGKSGRKVSGIAEAALMQKIKLDAAKTEAEWLNNKQKKMELLDVNILAETFEPVFLHIRTQLVSIARKNPDIQPEIDKCLEELCHLGERTLSKGSADLNGFITSKMEMEIDTGEEGIEDTPVLNSFSDYVPPAGEWDGL